MTQKRKHTLERKIRLYYKPYETKWCSFINAVYLLEQITNLLTNAVNLNFFDDNITAIELHFMQECIIKYDTYYFKKQIEMDVFS